MKTWRQMCEIYISAVLIISYFDISTTNKRSDNIYHIHYHTITKVT